MRRAMIAVLEGSARRYVTMDRSYRKRIWEKNGRCIDETKVRGKNTVCKRGSTTKGKAPGRRLAERRYKRREERSPWVIKRRKEKAKTDHAGEGRLRGRSPHLVDLGNYPDLVSQVSGRVSDGQPSEHR